MTTLLNDIDDYINIYTDVPPLYYETNEGVLMIANRPHIERVLWNIPRYQRRKDLLERKEYMCDQITFKSSHLEKLGLIHVKKYHSSVGYFTVKDLLAFVLDYEKSTRKMLLCRHIFDVNVVFCGLMPNEDETFTPTWREKTN